MPVATTSLCTLQIYTALNRPLNMSKKSFINAQLGFDPDAIEEKYRQEKEKRTRKDGATQYQQLEGAFEHLKLDAYADKTFHRSPIQSSVGALIVGGGYAGVLAAVRMLQKGFEDVLIVEKGASFGGTWYWNQYPG
jgi:heterodisulfide reductase subunit A-like polyferredoxin